MQSPSQSPNQANINLEQLNPTFDRWDAERKQQQDTSRQDTLARLQRKKSDLVEKRAKALSFVKEMREKWGPNVNTYNPGYDLNQIDRDLVTVEREMADAMSR